MIEISNNIEKDIFEIIVDGEVDASSSIHLDNALETALSGYNKVLVNLEKLEYISSAGLGVFIARLDEIKQNNVKMVLFGLNDKVRNVFRILGLDELLIIKPEKEAAIAQIEA